jgi:hypothetical protein
MILEFGERIDAEHGLAEITTGTAIQSMAGKLTIYYLYLMEGAMISQISVLFIGRITLRLKMAVLPV